MKSLTIVLPILPELRRAYRELPIVHAAINAAGGLTFLAEYCVRCEYDWDLFEYGVGEQIFAKLDTADIDPRKEDYQQKQLEKFMLSDCFHLFLRSFFDQHVQLYEQLLFRNEQFRNYETHQSIYTGRSDVVAFIFRP